MMATAAAVAVAEMLAANLVRMALAKGVRGASWRGGRIPAFHAGDPGSNPWAGL